MLAEKTELEFSGPINNWVTNICKLKKTIVIFQ